MAQETELPCVTRHCLLHAVDVLAPNGIHHVLPKSGSHKIERFCEELAQLTKARQRRKKGVSLPDPPLLQSIDIHKFYSGAISIPEFVMLVEQKIQQAMEGDVDLDGLQRLCWQYYETDKRSVITFPKWLSPECTYRLWLIFNTVHDHNLVTSIPRNTVNEVVKRLIELCGYTWNKSYQYTKQEEVDFPEYVEAITDYFDQLHLETSLTCEVIADLVDEVVNGVIKKGYLLKKGHKRKNWLKRWFILQRTILRYYESRNAAKLKGQLVLNARTEVLSIPDKGSRKYKFLVTCGHTGIPFQICADDQRTKHEWILAIRKAIALAKIIEGETTVKDDTFTESIAGFYLLKYGTEVPALSRQDSELQKMKYYTTARQFQRLSKVGVRTRDDITRHHSLNSTSSEDEPLEEYCEMQPGVQDIESSSDSGDEEGYLDMQPNRLGTVEEQEEDALAGLEYEVPLKSPSGGKSFLKGGTPTSPTEKPLIIIEPSLEDTPPPVVERPKSPLLYDKCTSGALYTPNRHSSVDGSYIQITRGSVDSGWGSIDIELPTPGSEDNTELSSNTQEKLPGTLGLKGDLLQCPTSTSGAGYLTILHKEGEQIPVPLRKARSTSRMSIQSPTREQSPPVVSPPGSRVSGRDSPLDTPPPPPPRVSPRHHHPLKPSFSGFPGENPPPVPIRRGNPHRLSSPPDMYNKVRSASQIDYIEDALDDVDMFSKSVTVGQTWGDPSHPRIPARHHTDKFVK